MLRPSLITLTVLVALTMGPALAWAGAEEGVWGVIQGQEATPKCGGTAVIVLRDGQYWRVLPNLGLTTGVRDYVMSRASYRVESGRVVVAPAFSLTNPEPGQRFLIDPIGPKLIREGKTRSIWLRCPEGTLQYFSE